MLTLQPGNDPPTVHSDNYAADRLPDPHDPIGLAAINGLSMVSREMTPPLQNDRPEGRILSKCLN